MPPADQQTDILEILKRHAVDFIVIGGVAAVLQGVPLVTFDTDIVHLRTRENVEKLVGALTELDAYYREHPDWRPAPEVDLLMGRGHHLLATTHGPIDVLCMLKGEQDYNSLLKDSEWIDLEDGPSVRVVTLETLIRLKEEAGRDKDRAVLPLLRATLREREQGS
jgi:hypothetical protein